MSTQRSQMFGRERRRFLKGVAAIGGGTALVLLAGHQGAQPVAAAPTSPRRAALATQTSTTGWRLTSGSFDTATKRPVRLAYSVRLGA